MKKWTSLLLALALVLAIAPCALAVEYIGITGGGTTGTYYALAGDIMSLWNAQLSGEVDVSVQSSNGSKDNVMKLLNGEAEIAFCQNDVMYYAYQGDKDFFAGEVIDCFTAIGALYPECVQIVVGKDSGITSVEELKGKNVSVGAIGSGVYLNAVQILAEAGLTIEDINPQYLNFDESSTAFQNKQIEAFFITSGVPNTSIIEVANKRDVDLLTLSEAQMASLMEKYAFYVPVTVPAGTYNGMDEDVVIPAVSAVLIVKNDLSEDVVYKLTSALFDNIDLLSHAKKSEISKEYAVTGIPVPFHPGAAKYWSEQGLIVAE